MHGPITDAVADILNEQDPDAARALLSEAILIAAEAALAARELRPLAEQARLIRGLDAHIELLARVQAIAPNRASAAAPALTPREQAVLHLMCSGCTAAAIGRRLGVSARTVHKHQEHLYRKLGASDRLGAVLVAQRVGILSAPRDEEDAVRIR